MYLEVFDVQHGACALATCDNLQRILIDSGHSAATGWKPGPMLKSRNVTRLEMLMVTNYDEDHVSGLPDLRTTVSIAWLMRNKSVNSNTIKQLKTEDGYGPGIDSLIDMIDSYTGAPSASTPLPTFAGATYQIEHNVYPALDDENNLSMLTLLKCHGVGVLFTGDLETKGWAELLKKPKVQQMLADTHIYVAPHHGRVSGIHNDIFNYCRPTAVVISDCGYKYDTQLTVPYYRSKTFGLPFRGERRHVLTTRRDRRIVFQFTPHGWQAA